jgi:Tfp pilus assembly protein PilN
MATKEATLLGTYVVPRVNLLPPEIAAKRGERRSYALMGLAVAGAGVTVAALYLGQASKVSAAKHEKADVATQSAKLDAKRKSLQSVQDTYAAVDADEALLTQAYSHRVIWSVYLHNLSISIPDNVWMTNFTATADGALTPPPLGGTDATYGTLTFAGKAFSYKDVAAWLDSTAKIKGTTFPYVSNVAEVKPGSSAGRTTVTFTANAGLTVAAFKPHTLGSQ